MLKYEEKSDYYSKEVMVYGCKDENPQSSFKRWYSLAFAISVTGDGIQSNRLYSCVMHNVSVRHELW